MKDYDNFPELTRQNMDAMIKEAESMLSHLGAQAGSVCPARRDMSDVEKHLAQRDAQREAVARNRFRVR